MIALDAHGMTLSLEKLYQAGEKCRRMSRAKLRVLWLTSFCNLLSLPAIKGLRSTARGNPSGSERLLRLDCTRL